MGTPLAFLVTLAVAAATGLLIYALIFRPLRHASELARAVASIGLLLLFLAIIELRYGDQPQSVPPILSTRNVHVAGVTTPLSYFEIGLITVAIAVGLWAVTRFTRFGLATLAAAEREKAVVLLGYSPDRLAAVNWIASSLIAALIGVLASPYIGLAPAPISFIVVPALAAALIGGMSSFALTTVAGIGIGIVQSLIFFYGTRTWFPHYGKGPTAIPFPGVFDIFVLGVILLALLLRSTSLPSRGATGQLKMPRSVTPRHSLARTLAFAGLAVVGMLTLSSAWRLGLTNTVVGVAICLSVVLLTGFVGQVSVAQLSIAGVAAFVMAKVALNWGLTFPLGPIIGVLCAAAFSLVVAMPALRIRGVNLAIVTLAIVEVVQNFVFALATKGGTQAGVNVAAPRFFGLKFGPLDKTSFQPLGDRVGGLLPNPFFGVFCIVVVALVALLVYRIRRSSIGLRFLAVRSNERVSSTTGFSVVRTKLLAFGLSAVIAGIGGALSAYRFGAVTTDYFTDIQALLFFAFAYMGGLGSVGGAIAAGMFVTGGIGSVVTTEWLKISTTYLDLLGGIGLILTVVLNPDGVAGKIIEQWEAAADRLRGVRGPRSEGATAIAQPAGNEPSQVAELAAQTVDGQAVPMTSQPSRESSG
jgi:branched-chain amino acid transport system permease protein